MSMISHDFESDLNSIKAHMTWLIMLYSPALPSFTPLVGTFMALVTPGAVPLFAFLVIAYSLPRPEAS